MHSTAFPRCFVLILAALLLICLFSASAFGETSALILPASLKRVEAQAFFNDSSIRSIVIPDGASSIGDEAFSGCTSLTEITIPESVISIGDNAFSGCDDLTIRCHSGSYAASYAQSHGMNLSYIDAYEMDLICTGSTLYFAPATLTGSASGRVNFATLRLPDGIRLDAPDQILVSAVRTDDNSENTLRTEARYDSETGLIYADLADTNTAAASGSICARVGCEIYNAQNECVYNKFMEFTISFGEARVGELFVDQKIHSAFIGEEYYDRMLYARLDNYPLQPGEIIVWDLEQLAGMDNYAKVKIYYNDITDIDPEMGEFYLVGLPFAHAGTLKYRLNCRILDSAHAEIAKYSSIFSIELLDKPDDLPSAITLPQETYRFEVGETHRFLYSDIGFADGAVPEGMNVAYEYSGYMVDVIERDETGVTAEFQHKGRYIITAYANFNTLQFKKAFMVYVGTGVSDQAYIDTASLPNTVAVRSDRNTYFGGHCFVEGLETSDSDSISWTLTCLDSTGNPPALTVDRQNGFVSASNPITSANVGSASYRVACTVTDINNVTVFNGTNDFTVNFVPAAENFPTGIECIGSPYALLSGSSLSLNFDDIVQFTGGTLPEGVGIDDIEVIFESGDRKACSWTTHMDTHTVDFMFRETGVYTFRLYLSTTIEGYDTFETQFSVIVGDQSQSLVCTNRINHVACNALMQNKEISLATLRLPDGVHVGTDDQIFVYAIRTDDNREVTVKPWAYYNPQTLQIIASLYDSSSIALSWDDYINIRVVCEIYNAQNECTYSGSINLPVCFSDAEEPSITDITLPQTSYTIAVGETLNLSYSDIQSEDVDPEDSEIIRYYSYDQVFDTENKNQAADDGETLRIFFGKPGSYTLYAHMGNNNSSASAPIYITVGDDPYAAADFDFTVRSGCIYLNPDADSAFIGGYGPIWGLGDLSEKWVQATVDPETEDQPELSVDYITSVDASTYLINVELMNLAECVPGSYSYNITLKVTDAAGNAVFTKVNPFTINLQEMPESMPTGIRAKQTSYSVQPGDTLHFDLSDIEFIGGTLPQDVVPELSVNPTSAKMVYRSENSFCFPLPGVYMVDLTAFVNNLYFYTTVPVTVGDGDASEVDAELIVNQNVSTFYLSDDASQNSTDVSIANLYFGALPANYDHVEWKITPLYAWDNSPKLYISNSWNHGSDIELRVRKLPEETVWHCSSGNWVSYKVYDADGNCLASGGRAIDVSFERLGGTPPTDFELPCGNSVHLEPGEGFALNYDEISFTDGTLPSGVKPVYSIWIDNDDHYIRRSDSHQIEYVFVKPCRTIMDIGVQIENIVLHKRLAITVGDAAPSSLSMTVHKEFTTIYFDSDTEDTLWCATAYLDDFTSYPDETLEWSLERVSDDSNPVQLVIDAMSDSMDWISMSLSNMSKAVEGDLEYRLTCRLYDGDHQVIAQSTKPIRFKFEPTPDNLPTALTLPQTEYQLEIGELLDLKYADIGFADGVIPEGADIWKEYTVNNGNEDVVLRSDEWSDDGRSLSFAKAGRYIIRARANVNSLTLYGEINVAVDAQSCISASIVCPIETETITLDEDDSLNYIYTNYNLNDWDFMHEDETYAWTLTILEKSENAPEPELSPPYASASHDHVFLCLKQLSLASTGYASIRISFTANDAQGNPICTASTDFRLDFSADGNEFRIDCMEI